MLGRVGAGKTLGELRFEVGAGESCCYIRTWCWSWSLGLGWN